MISWKIIKMLNRNLSARQKTPIRNFRRPTVRLWIRKQSRWCGNDSNMRRALSTYGLTILKKIHQRDGLTRHCRQAYYKPTNWSRKQSSINFLLSTPHPVCMHRLMKAWRAFLKINAMPWMVTMPRRRNQIAMAMKPIWAWSIITMVCSFPFTTVSLTTRNKMVSMDWKWRDTYLFSKSELRHRRKMWRLKLLKTKLMLICSLLSKALRFLLWAH